ncbi:hypothetical protein [Labrys neptuniae]
MTKLLEQAVAELRKLPAEMQDDFAHFVLALANEDAFVLTPEDEAALAEAEAELVRGEAISPEKMRTFWSAHGL